jgi:hypothetical protein
MGLTGGLAGRPESVSYARATRIEAELTAERARPKKPGQADPDRT